MRYALVIWLKLVELALGTTVPWWVGGWFFPDMPAAPRWLMGASCLALLLLTVTSLYVLLPLWWRLNCRWVDRLLRRKEN